MAIKLVPWASVLYLIFPIMETARAAAGNSFRGNAAEDTNETIREALTTSPTWQLQMDLLTGYNPRVKPVQNFNDPVNVTVNFILFNLISLDESDQTFSTNCELVLVWNDYFLQWIPEEYGGVEQIWVDPDKIWRPDVILYNSASSDYNAGLVYTNAILNNDGTVRLLINGAFKSVCNTLNVDYFPFDEQICYLKFSPWTMDIRAVRLIPFEDMGDLKLYTPIGEFKMISVVAESHTDYDPCCPNTTFDDITYYVKIHRRPMFFIINYIFPSVLINAIGTMVFYVPCDSGEKVTLGISAMLTMVVFLMTMTNAMPPATATPLLSIYYCTCVVLVTAEVLFSILVLNIFHRGQFGKRASDSTIAAAVFMAKVTFTDLRDPSGHFANRKAEMAEKLRRFWNREERPESSTVAPMGGQQGQIDTSMRSLTDKMAEEEFWRPGVQSMPVYRSPDSMATRKDDFAAKFHLGDHSKGTPGDNNQGEPILPSGNMKLETAVVHLVKQADKALQLMAMTQQVHVEDEYKESLKIEFMELARVYDRFFLVMSIIATAVTSVGILMSSPYSVSGSSGK